MRLKKAQCRKFILICSFFLFISVSILLDPRIQRLLKECCPISREYILDQEALPSHTNSHRFTHSFTPGTIYIKGFNQKETWRTRRKPTQTQKECVKFSEHYGWMDGPMDGLMDGQTDRWTNGWMDPLFFCHKVPSLSGIFEALTLKTKPQKRWNPSIHVVHIPICHNILMTDQ